MRRTWKWTWLLAGLLFGTTTGGTAAAQFEEPVEAEPAPEAEVTAEVEVAAEPPPPVVLAPPPPPVVEAEPEPEPAAAPADPEPSVWDRMSLNVFGDAYYMVDWNRPDSRTAPQDVGHRAFDSQAGFGLAFGGLDFRYAGDQFGATVDLRFGDGAARLLGNANPVFSVLKQAYVSWTPSEMLSFDLGQFDTIYGAEVADSWRNLNYTRGALYYLMQPFYHTGLRAKLTLNDRIGLTAMLVNGTNNPVNG
ncbi:MAG: outer membrane beta-barrel protein, partial [Myxococcales bacterium]|nr:outer membrane beta-barrel protein [Myxococcales bacterium]